MQDVQIDRLTAADTARARDLFATIAHVFETEPGDVSDIYLARLLGRDEFWALAASVEGRLVGGLTAYTLPLTASERSELFVYDVAVLPGEQRKGIGRRLIAELRSQAAARGITTVFVPADNEDGHALDFYRALGGEAAAVTIFTFES